MRSSTRARWSDAVSQGAEIPALVASPPTVETSLGMKLLPSVLSLTAGSVDVIGFLGLNGLFTAHVTGNLAILAAHVVTGDPAILSYLVSVPVFMAVLLLTRLLAGSLEAIGFAPLRPLLLLQALLLAGFLGLRLTAGPRVDPDMPTAIAAGMLGVAAMAVQNALVQVALTGVPSTAVMTTNVTRFMTDVGTLLIGRDPGDVVKARRRTKDTWPVIVGFTVGCALGACGQALIGLRSLALPVGLAVLAFAMGRASPQPVRAGAMRAFSRQGQLLNR